MCNKRIKIRYPKYSGIGYSEFERLRGVYKRMRVEIDFRPDTSNGLLIYTGEFSNARMDFFSLILVESYVEFRFDCGSGVVSLRSDYRVRLSKWNKVILQRTGAEGWLELNNASRTYGRSQGSMTRITIRQNLFIGGIRNRSKQVSFRTGMNWGFVGCIRELIINDKRYDMREDIYGGDMIAGVDIDECSGHTCDQVTCDNGGACVSYSADTSICLCPLGTTGPSCQNKVDIEVPKFKGMSYLQFVGLRKSVLSYTRISFTFKPDNDSSNGLILYNGYATNRNGDFVAILLNRGHLEFRYDLGTGPAIIRSKYAVKFSDWNTAVAIRSGRKGSLKLNDQAIQTGISKGAYNQLTLTLDLFIGGHRNFDEVAHKAKMTINDKPISLMKSSIGGRNVDNCDHSCVARPCQHGGKCIPRNSGYDCICSIGFHGNHCQRRVTRFRYRYRFIRGLKETFDVPMFSGLSYLQYSNNDMLYRMEGYYTNILMKIKIMNGSQNALLLWMGGVTKYPNTDFLSIGLRDSRIHLTFNLGDAETSITNEEVNINDGKWHRIQVIRQGKTASIDVDEFTSGIVTSLGILDQLNVKGNMYIGGAPDIVYTTERRYTNGFYGCLSEMTLSTDYRVDLIDSSDTGSNVTPCS